MTSSENFASTVLWEGRVGVGRLGGALRSFVALLADAEEEQEAFLNALAVIQVESLPMVHCLHFFTSPPH